MRSSLSLLALAGAASAHFVLKHPESVGDSDSTADQEPCGGYTPDISEGSGELVDVHVGGEALALVLTHSRATWLFRATLNSSVDDANWERLYPNTVQSGLGDFCIPSLTYPDDWAGKRGVIGVVSSAEDGNLYQCIAANFVEGSADAPSSCKNASSVSAYFTEDAALDALVGQVQSNDSSSDGGHDHDDGSHSHDETSTTGAAGAEETNADGAATALQRWSTGGLASFVSVVTMMMFGGALMI